MYHEYSQNDNGKSVIVNKNWNVYMKNVERKDNKKSSLYNRTCKQNLMIINDMYVNHYN